jgi:hypothetical protein
LKPIQEERPVPVFMQPALVDKYHYLVLYNGGYKYLFDIYYCPFTALRSEVTYYDEINSHVVDERDNIWSDCKQMLK